MLIIGELINTSREAVATAVRERDAAFIAVLAYAQAEAGATYIDINAGTFVPDDAAALVWLAGVVSDTTTASICFDSPNPAALGAALRLNARTGRPAMVNSISGEATRYAAVLPLVQQYHTRVIALALDDTGIHADAGQRLPVARTLVRRLLADGIPADDIYLDPLLFPVGIGEGVITTFLEIVRVLRSEFPAIHLVAGLSNVSYGMPARRLLNQAMAVLALGHGLDALILNPLDDQLLALLSTSEALLGHDEDCREFLHTRRNSFRGL